MVYILYYKMMIPYFSLSWYITAFRAPVAKWLANEVSAVISSECLTSDLLAECSFNPSSCLTPLQNQIVGVVCRLPDLLTNRLGHSLPSSLMPPAYFKLIGSCLFNCLESIYTSIKGEDGLVTWPHPSLAEESGVFL